MSSPILARDGDKLLLAWDIQQDPITDNATSSSGPRDPNRLMLLEGQWKDLLKESPYRITYVTFAPVLCAEANVQDIKQILPQLEEPRFAEHFQFIIDIVPVMLNEELTSEDRSMQLAFCTAQDLKNNTEVGLCKRFQKRMLTSPDKRAYISYLAHDGICLMKEGKI